MSLQKILSIRPEGPYGRPPPIHIHIIDMQEQVLVLSWHFEDGVDPRPRVSKKKQVAIITDGNTVTKITLFEEFSSKIKAGQSYVMRGYFHIIIGKDTMFFHSSDRGAEKLGEEAFRPSIHADPAD